MQRIRKRLQLLLAVVLMFAAYEMVPPYLKAYVFHDDIVSIAREATYDATRGTHDGELVKSTIEERVRDEVMLRAMDLGIALNPEHLQVMRDDQRVVINADYTVHADLVLRQYDLKFQVTSQSR